MPEPPFSSKRWSTTVGAALVLSLCSALVNGCGQQSAVEPAADAAEEASILRAEVLKVADVSWPTIVQIQGSLMADEVAVVGAKVAGRVWKVSVDLGDEVAEGAPLVTLDEEEFRLQVEQAEAQLQQARAAVGLRPDDPVEQLDPLNAPPVREAKAVWDEARAKEKRWTQLLAQNVITEEEFQQYVAGEQVAAAKYASAVNSVNEKIAVISTRTAELSLARQRLADAVVPAPFQGVVQERHVAPGSFVQIGEPIVTIVRIHPLHFRGSMPERPAQRLQLGQEVRLRIDSVSEPIVVRVTRINPAIDRFSRSLMFEAEVDNADGRLRTGLFAEAQVVIDEAAEAIVVPESAVTEFAGVEKVWTAVDGMAREQVVLTGERRDDRIEILEGLVAGDLVLCDAREGRAARFEPVESSTNRKAVLTAKDASFPGEGERAAPAATDADVPRRGGG